MTLLVVAIGGAAGAVSRYLTSSWIHNLTSGSFPWGTMAVNVIGSLALGFLFVWLQSVTSSAHVRELIVIGFLGSFTTFSTFSFETVQLVRGDEWARAAGYATGSVVLGVLALSLGMAIAVAVTQGAQTS